MKSSTLAVPQQRLIGNVELVEAALRGRRRASNGIADRRRTTVLNREGRRRCRRGRFRLRHRRRRRRSHVRPLSGDRLLFQDRSLLTQARDATDNASAGEKAPGARRAGKDRVGIMPDLVQGFRGNVPDLKCCCRYSRGFLRHPCRKPALSGTDLRAEGGDSLHTTTIVPGLVYFCQDFHFSQRHRPQHPRATETLSRSSPFARHPRKNSSFPLDRTTKIGKIGKVTETQSH